MNYVENYQYGTVAANAVADERVDFIRKTYLHLAGAVMAFALLEGVLIQSGIARQILLALAGTRYSWLIVLLAFAGVSHVANNWALSQTSIGMQYAGLSLYVVAESLIMCPLVMLAYVAAPGALPIAATITLAMFAGLTFIVFITAKDFSFLGSILGLAGLAAIALIVCSILFGFNLGIVFVVAMIALACGYILYDTSNVLHRYRIGQHVAASLALFAAVALLFWYVLRLVMSLRRN